MLCILFRTCVSATSVLCLPASTTKEWQFGLLRSVGALASGAPRRFRRPWGSEGACGRR
jgi:hypothetical protein